MVSLNDLAHMSFSSPAGKISVCEKGGRLCTLPIHEITGNAYVSEYYPEVNINREMFNTTRCAADSYQNQSLILPVVNEHILKKITRTFFEDGINAALEEAANPQTFSKPSNPIISYLATFTLKGLHLFNRFKSLILPHLIKIETGNIAQFAVTRDWLKSSIRYIAWHPNCFKIAVAGSDDIIRIYKDEPALVPVLKYFQQRSIMSMAWRPYSGAELAVGCECGICFWTFDNSLYFSKASSQASMLRYGSHFPVTSVEWSPDGEYLASASINDSDILIWNVDKVESAPLKRVGPPCSLLKWSPDGSYLFTSTISSVFRVWSRDSRWKAERWISFGTIQSAAWSPCGSFLLFVTSKESILYRLQFFEEQLFANSNSLKQALPIADLSKVEMNDREIGGQPQSIVWDGNYLAISFKDTSSICIFSTNVTKYNLNISPSCFLTGIETEYPSFICFQSKNRRNSDSVLTIGWSSGRIQYFPFILM